MCVPASFHILSGYIMPLSLSRPLELWVGPSTYFLLRDIYSHSDKNRWVSSAEEMAITMLQSGVTDVGYQVESIARKASEEISQGAAVQYGKLVLVAQKE